MKADRLGGADQALARRADGRRLSRGTGVIFAAGGVITISHHTSRTRRVKQICAPGYNQLVAYRCERAKPHDLGRALELLRQEKLPEAGVVEQFGHFLVVREDTQLIGVCGIEVHGQYGMLRSVAVDRGFRETGVGDCLVRGAVELSEKLGLNALYLLTTTAQRYFERYGFHATARDEAPIEIRESWELRAGCPETAVLMKRSLSR